MARARGDGRARHGPRGCRPDALSWPVRPLRHHVPARERVGPRTRARVAPGQPFPGAPPPAGGGAAGRFRGSAPVGAAQRRGTRRPSLLATGALSFPGDFRHREPRGARPRRRHVLPSAACASVLLLARRALRPAAGLVARHAPGAAEPWRPLPDGAPWHPQAGRQAGRGPCRPCPRPLGTATDGRAHGPRPSGSRCVPRLRRSGMRAPATARPRRNGGNHSHGRGEQGTRPSRRRARPSSGPRDGPDGTARRPGPVGGPGRTPAPGGGLRPRRPSARPVPRAASRARTRGSVPAGRPAG